MAQAVHIGIPGAPSTLLVRSPYDGRLVGEVAAASDDDIARAVGRARRAQHAFRRSTPFQRRTLLDALAECIATHAE